MAQTTLTGSTRLGSINYTIDGGGSPITPGTYGQLQLPANMIITGWSLTADQSGDAVVDVLASTFAAFPTTASIAGSDKPTLASEQAAENLAVNPAIWDVELPQYDLIQFAVDSASTVTRLNITLFVLVL